MGDFQDSDRRGGLSHLADNLRLDYGHSNRLAGLRQLAEYLLVRIGAYDGAARARKIRRGARGSRHVHHFEIARINSIDRRTQVEVGIHQLIQPRVVPLQQAGASFGGVTGPRPIASTTSASPRSQRSRRLLWNTSVPSLSDVR